MRKTTRNWLGALYLLLLYFDQTVLTQPVSEHDHHHHLNEGSRCQFGRGQGIYRKLIDCPEKMRAIRTNHRTYDDDRCGYPHSEEMVCCLISLSGKVRHEERPAAAACERFKKTVPKLEEESDYPSGIINGDAAEAGEFPYMAALVYPASDDEEGAIRGRKYFCGGTLISEKHVVTAAHCVSGSQGSEPVQVLLGTVDLVEPDSATMQRIPISRIIRHPEYSQALAYHDVAILELEYPAQLTAYVQPICLMTKPWPHPIVLSGLRFEILGWGLTDFGETQSTLLQKAGGLKFVGKNECSKTYEDTLPRLPNGLDDGMICAIDADSTKGADGCLGDSGGPLLLPSSSSSQLVGIVSFGKACGGSTPGVYVSIYKYLNWIEEQVWRKSN